MSAGASFWSSTCDTKNAFCKKFTPSGVLTKAILLHSGTGMIRYDGGLCNCGKPTTYLGAPPDSTQGYGRITLSNVLPLKGVYNFNLFVEDLTTITSNNKIIYHAHVLSSSTPLKYVHPPSSILPALAPIASALFMFFAFLCFSSFHLFGCNYFFAIYNYLSVMFN